MKKLFLVLAAAFAMVACQTDINEVGVVAGGEVDVTFEVGTPTRAYSDGLTANQLQYAVYEVVDSTNELSAPILPSLTKTGVIMNNLSATIKLQLVTGNTYAVVFWAAAPNAPYTVVFGDTLNDATMTVDYTNALSNDENRDAFFKKHVFTVKGAQTETIELRRPFAQLNIGTNDYDASANAGYVPVNSYVEVAVYNTLNLATGEVDGQATQTFNYAAINKDETFPVGGYEYLAMNYLLVDADKETVDVEFAYTETDATAAKTRIVGSVPVQRNYRTNIYGQLLTSDVDINIEIKPEYEEPAYNIEQLLADQLAQGGYIKLTDNIVLNNNVTGFVITADTEIDLDGKTITIPDTDATRSASSAKASIFTVEGDANFTIKNGTIVIPSTNGNFNGTNSSTGAGNAIKFDSTGKLVVENVTIEASKRGGWRAIEVYAGEAEINNSSINCYHGSGVNSSNAKVTLNNCDITVNGMYSAPYNSVCFSVMYGGELTVNGGNYKIINDAVYSTGNTHGGWLGIVMSSGGTLILNDGTFENVPADGFNPAYERAIIEAENNAPAVATVVFAGGKYKPQGSKIYSGYGDKYYPTWVNEEKLTLGEDGWYTIADNKGYVVNGDEYLVSTGAGLAAAVVDAPANAKITLTANVDLTDVAYTPRTFTSLVFNGNHHTISGVKVEGVDQAALFGKTWSFDIQNVTIANSSFSANNVDGEDAAAAFIAFLQTYSPGSKLVNCHVDNCTIGNAKYAGGLVAYKDGTYPIALENCSVKNSTISSNYTEDGGANYKGHCGGLVGYFCGEANSTIVNCVVEGNTFDVKGPRCGLFIGTAQANYAVSGEAVNNTGLYALCGAINKITDWSNVAVVTSVSANDELTAAIANNVTIVLAEGTYVLPTNAQGKTLTFVGSGDPANTVIATNTSGSYEGCNYALDGSTVVFKNISITTDNNTYTGYARCKATFENCIINNSLTLYDTCTFNNCVLNVSGDQYNIWTWGAPVATFNNCVFNSDGKAMLLYGQANTQLTINGCTFNDSGVLPDLKAAIEIGNDYNTSYNLVVNNTVVNGYEINDKGINTGTTLWANKNSMGQDKLNVVVDGVDVY